MGKEIQRERQGRKREEESERKRREGGGEEKGQRRDRETLLSKGDWFLRKCWRTGTRLLSGGGLEGWYGGGVEVITVVVQGGGKTKQKLKKLHCPPRMLSMTHWQEKMLIIVHLTHLYQKQKDHAPNIGKDIENPNNLKDTQEPCTHYIENMGAPNYKNWPHTGYKRSFSTFQKSTSYGLQSLTTIQLYLKLF